MQENKKIYNAIDLAKMFCIHSNTIRLYEKLGFISKAERNTNNYRMFEELHILQINVCRCIFGYPFTNKRIRNAGNEIMWAIAKKQLDTALQCTDYYIKIINQEITTAQNAAQMLRNWINPSSDKESSLKKGKLSRKDVANYLGVTVESIRNWERNDLIASDGIGEKGETLYSDGDLGKMCIISMLLQAGYSIASIHRSISTYNKGHNELSISILNNPNHEDLVSVGDRWLYELNKLMKAAQKIPLIINEIKNLTLVHHP